MSAPVALRPSARAGLAPGLIPALAPKRVVRVKTRRGGMRGALLVTLFPSGNIYVMWACRPKADSEFRGLLFFSEEELEYA